LGRTVTKQILMQEEIKKTDSGNSCYHSVQKLHSSRLLSKSLKIRMYKTAILPAVLYECEIAKVTSLPIVVTLLM
jgi:hypothetical protein